MSNKTKTLYAVELDITEEAKFSGYRLIDGEYWVIHQ